MIIGINGRARSGKDTVAKMIVDLHPEWFVERIAFADKLKESAAALLGISIEMLELLKTTDTKVILDPDPDLDPDLYNDLLDIEMTMRAFLQRYGTEAHREVFSDSFWIDQAFASVVNRSNPIVITDMRFPNEVYAVKKRGGYTVKVRRTEAEELSDDHASEQHIPDEEFDFVIANDGSLEELEWKVGQVFEAILTGDH